MVTQASTQVRAVRPIYNRIELRQVALSALLVEFEKIRLITALNGIDLDQFLNDLRICAKLAEKVLL